MADAKHLQARDARDRLIDLLGLGKTFPLRDLDVRNERLVVPFETTAKIPIENSQRSVEYELRDPASGAVIPRGGGPARVDGNGDTALLETPPIRQNASYAILARKRGPPPEDSTTEALLHQLADVRVGLDTTLDARIINLPPLVPTPAQPRDSAPRIGDHGCQVEVQIEGSQEGVTYALIDRADPARVLSEQDVAGDLHEIVLRSQPLTEDVDLQIRASKVFPSGEATQTATLDNLLPVKVRASRAPTLALRQAVLEQAQNARAVLSGTQSSATYALYARPVRMSEYVYSAVPGDAIEVAVAADHRVRVKRPGVPGLWSELPGFVAQGAAKRGAAAPIELSAARLTRDQVLLVRAHKDHDNGPIGASEGAKIPSDVWLVAAALVLVRPNPAQALELSAWMADGATSGTLEVRGGEPGVFYEVRTDPAGNPISLPAYFHQRDEDDAGVNHGVAARTRPAVGLRVAVDFALARRGAGPTRGDTLPPAPRLETGPLAADTTLSVRAVRASTRLDAALASGALLAATPVLRADASVARGAEATITVVASRSGERYQLQRDGLLLGPARDGDGADLVLRVGPLTEDAAFELRMTRPGSPGLVVERCVRIEIRVT